MKQIAILLAILLVFFLGAFILQRKPAQQPSPGVWEGLAVVYEITNLETKEKQSASFTLNSPAYKTYGYSFKLVNTDYATFAQVLVENLTSDESQTFNLEKEEEATFNKVKIKILNFINSPCPPGAQC